MKKIIFLLSAIIYTLFLFACSENIYAPQENSADTKKFSSIEEAYYNKYVELAEIYGTHALYDAHDVKHAYRGRSYLSGVCIVNLMDFNEDGIEDLFIVYSNGKMDRVMRDGFNLEIYDFPTKKTYEIEVWTYADGELMQLLHETAVGHIYNYPPANYSEFYRAYYQNFITVYENNGGFPVIQIYDEDEERRYYTNVYFPGGNIARDELSHDGTAFLKNGIQVTEDTWRENVVGYNKILLCALLADSSRTSSSLLQGYDIDYNNTLAQTAMVVRYLSQEDRAPAIPKFYVAEGAYIQPYLEQLEAMNRLMPEGEFTENHHYALYDMVQDGIPELILYEGSSGAGMHYHFFTIINSEAVYLGTYGRTTLLADGMGGLIAYDGRMGYYHIDKISIDGNELRIDEITSGQMVFMQTDNGDDYEIWPELEDFGHHNYDVMAFCPPIPLALYTYDMKLFLIALDGLR